MYGVRRVVLSGVVVLSTIAVVTGCADPTPAPLQTEVAIATPTPTPTPTAAAAPLPTLPVKCVDILTDAEASAILDFPVSLKIDETDVRGSYPASQRQAGLLTCIWGGVNKTDNSWDQSIRLNILPNAVEAYDAGVWQNDDGATPYTVGELSEYLCDPYNLCDANLLLDGYWAQMRASFDSDALAKSAKESKMSALLDRVAEVVSEAGPPNTGWVAPPGVVEGAFCSDPVASAAAVGGAFNSPTIVADVPPAQEDYQIQFVDFVARDRGGYLRCSWSGPGYISYSVNVVPGGSWAVFEMIESKPSISYNLPPLETVNIVGTDGATLACSGQGFCSAIVTAGGSLIDVSGPDIGESAFIAAVAALVPEIVAAG